MVLSKNLLPVLCAGLLFSPAAFAQQSVQTGTQQEQTATPTPRPGRMAYHPGPPVTEGDPVRDRRPAKSHHIEGKAMALVAAQKVTLHDEIIRQLNAAPDHMDLKIAAIILRHAARGPLRGLQTRRSRGGGHP